VAVSGVLPGGEDEHGVQVAEDVLLLGGAVVGTDLAQGAEGGE
jgi:hypothetical protein